MDERPKYIPKDRFDGMDFGSDVVDAVSGYDYVSLDVYDTLLVRPYIRTEVHIVKSVSRYIFGSFIAECFSKVF